MSSKELNNNIEEKNIQEVGGDIVVPATGVDVEAVVPESVAVVTEAVSPEAAPLSKITPGRKMRGDTANNKGQRGGRPSRGGRGEPRERVKPEFDSKIIDIRRVTRVVTGGRRYNFSVAVVAGDRKGRVGVGLGKGNDTALAVDKATRDAKKNLIKVPLSAQMTIPHAVEAKYASASIVIFPARGRGVVAGSSARTVIELAGIKDVCAKIMSGSKNRLNNARAAIEALSRLSKMNKKDLVAK